MRRKEFDGRQGVLFRPQFGGLLTWHHPCGEPVAFWDTGRSPSIAQVVTCRGTLTATPSWIHDS